MYLHALSKAPRVAPDQIPSDGTKGPRRGLFLDAFATCLISKERKRRGHAIALRTAPFEPPTLYIAGNEVHVPILIQDHCNSIANTLCEISRRITQDGGLNTASSDLCRNLHICIAQHTLQKMIKHVDKVSDEEWLAHQQHFRGQLKASLYHSELPIYDEVVRCIEEVRRVVRTGNLENIVSCCSALEVSASTDSVKQSLDILEYVFDTSEQLAASSTFTVRTYLLIECLIRRPFSKALYFQTPQNFLQR